MRTQKVIVDERIPRIKQLRRERANRQLIFLAFLFFIVIVLIIYFQSPLSRLQRIEVENHLLVDREKILHQAGIHEGISYFDFSIGEVAEKLVSLPEVASVRVERKLPNRLRIVLTEYPTVAFWLENHELYPVLANGYIGDQPWKEDRIILPVLNGWPHREGVAELSKELDRLSPAILQLVSEILLTPVPSDPYRLTLFMTDGNEVKTTIHQFSQQLSWYPHILDTLQEEGREEGVIYLLEGTWSEEVAPSAENEDNENEAEKEG